MAFHPGQLWMFGVFLFFEGGCILGVLKIAFRAFWGLHWGPLFLENYHLGFKFKGS